MDVDDDAAPGAVGESLCLWPVDQRVLLELVGTVAKPGQALLRVPSPAPRKVLARFHKLVHRDASELLATAEIHPGGVLKEAVMCKPGIQVDGRPDRAGAVIRHEKHVRVGVDG